MPQLPDLKTVLRLDAVANVALGGGMLLGAELVTGPLGITSAWPVRLTGAVLVVYGVEQWLVARAEQPSRSAVTAIVAFDVLFAVAALTLVVTDPTAAAGWLRWALAALGDVAGARPRRGTRR